MKQGEIWQVYFDPVKGSEQRGNRPAVVVSGNTLNKYLNIVIVCPLTTSIKNYEGNPILKPNNSNGLTKPSEIIVFHIRSLSKERFKKKIGIISENEMKTIKDTLDDILRY